MNEATRSSSWPKIASLLAGAALVAGAAGAAPPRQVEIGYQIARNGTVIAEVTDRLEHDGRDYRLTEVWRGKGVYALRGEATRTSRGAIAADGLRPRHFEDRRTGRDPRVASFEAAATPTLERQDRLSFIWNFSFAPPRKAVTVKVADGKGVSTYVYEPSGRERVRTPAGEFDALKLVKRRDGPEDRGAEIWLAADRGFVPVRILVLEKDGTRLDQVAATIAVK